MDNKIEADVCYICGHGNPDSLEEHHIIPRRYGGSDASENLVDLCPSCHDGVERIYDNLFFEMVQSVLEDDDTARGEKCMYSRCTSHDTNRFENGEISVVLCEAHQNCARGNCDRRVTPVPRNFNDIGLLCNKHRECDARGCFNSDVRMFINRKYCETHAQNHKSYELIREAGWIQ